MAAEGRRAAATVAEELLRKPYRFEFFQAVRLLERIYATRQPVGHLDVNPAREVVRFRPRLSYDFPPSELYEFVNEDDGQIRGDEQPELVVAFMGLAGALGVLPNHYADLMLRQERDGDTALRQFLDLFNHRLISLFYRAWEKYHFPIAYERRRQRDAGARRAQADGFTEYLFHLVGLGTGGLRGRLGLPGEGLLLYGGLLAQRPRSASAVESILGDYFRVPVRLVQFAGQWFELDEESISRLGDDHGRLGENTIAGSRVWDNQSKIRFRFGPLTLAAFKDFLPAGTAFRPVAELTRLLVGMEFDFDLQLVLRADEVPASRLGGRDEDAPQLGRTSWLKTRDFTADDEQVVLPLAS